MPTTMRSGWLIWSVMGMARRPEYTANHGNTRQAPRRVPLQCDPFQRGRSAEMDQLLPLPELPPPDRGAGLGLCRLRGGQDALHPGHAHLLRLIARREARLLRRLRLDVDVRGRTLAERSAPAHRRVRRSLDAGAHRAGVRGGTPALAAPGLAPAQRGRAVRL